MYPYRLRHNPYPSSSTPTALDAQVLGGTRHKEAKQAVTSCIYDLKSKLGSSDATSLILAKKESRLVTIIQDVGSGKTHLALHIKELREIQDNTIVSYVDLSQISPRDMHSLYKATLSGLGEDYAHELRKRIIHYIRDLPEQDRRSVKKIFGYGFFDSMTGKNLTHKAQQVLENKLSPNYPEIDSLLSKKNFSSVETALMRLIIAQKLNSHSDNVSSLEEIISSLSAISNINLRFLGKSTIFQIDEFDSDKESLSFIKAAINAHLPSSIIMLIMTPSSYEQIRCENMSVFDRLEKANYKIDLAGSNTLDEISDIIAEYIRYYDDEKSFTTNNVNDLKARIKVIYDAFPDFRNVRSMINIMYHAMENARRRNNTVVDEYCIDESIKSIYPGLKVRDSIMKVPISEFIKIQKDSADIYSLEAGVREAVKNLINVARETGSVAEHKAGPVIQQSDENSHGIDVTYNDPSGSKVAVSVVINKDHARSFEQISNTMKSKGFTDKLLILTNANALGDSNGTTVVNIDRSKMVDLIYFSTKYKNNQIMQEDLQRAISLAKSIKLC